jgi:hypothetical protein
MHHGADRPPAGSVAAGDCWTYRAPEGFEDSRIVVGAIVRFEDAPAIVCVSVSAAPQRQPDGSIIAAPIQFLPMSEAAFSQTVRGRDGVGEPAAGFSSSLEAWQSDAGTRGLSYFTVPFEGYLDRMIAVQMAELAAAGQAH